MFVAFESELGVHRVERRGEQFICLNDWVAAAASRPPEVGGKTRHMQEEREVGFITQNWRSAVVAEGDID